MSTSAERLTVIYQAYQTARSNQTTDLMQATTDQEVNAILGNVATLNVAYLEAVNADLSANSAGIEAVYQAAKDAAAAANEARERAQGLINIIKKTTELANNVKSLVDALT